MKNQKVVLAYSGGLDTSFCVKYLTIEKNMEVHAVLVNTGGFEKEEIKTVKEIENFDKITEVDPIEIKTDELPGVDTEMANKKIIFS